MHNFGVQSMGLLLSLIFRNLQSVKIITHHLIWRLGVNEEPAKLNRDVALRAV
jgi:hypothetical protein